MQHKDVPSMPIKQKPTGAKTIVLIPAGEQCCYEVAGPRARKVSSGASVALTLLIRGWIEVVV